MKEDEVEDWRMTFDQLHPLIRRFVPLSNLNRAAGVAGFPVPSVHDADIEGLLRVREFETLLALRVSNKNDLLGQYYTPLKAESDQITRLIRSELEGR